MADSAPEGKGLLGEPVCEILNEAVEKCFGHVKGIPQAHVLELLLDNGGAYVATETRQLARNLGLRSITVPVCSPQNNGMAEILVNTFKRDYIDQLDSTYNTPKTF